MNISVKCQQGKGQRGEAVKRMSAQARSPEVDELSCVPESAGIWGGGVGGGSGESSAYVGYRIG